MSHKVRCISCVNVVVFLKIFSISIHDDISSIWFKLVKRLIASLQTVRQYVDGHGGGTAFGHMLKLFSIHFGTVYTNRLNI